MPIRSDWLRSLSGRTKDGSAWGFKDDFLDSGDYPKDPPTELGICSARVVKARAKVPSDLPVSDITKCIWLFLFDMDTRQRLSLCLGRLRSQISFSAVNHLGVSQQAEAEATGKNPKTKREHDPIW